MADERNRQVEAATRLFVSDLHRVFHIAFLPVARRYASEWERRSNKLEVVAESISRNRAFLQENLDERSSQSLNEEGLRALRELRQRSEDEIQDPEGHAQQELARQKLEQLELLLQAFQHPSRKFVERFRPFAKSLEGEENRRRVTYEATERVLPIVRELCELFGAPGRAEKWKAEFETWLAAELQRIADERTINPVPERDTNPSRENAVESASHLTLRTRFPDPKRRFIAEIIAQHPDYTAKEICAEADRRRAMRAGAERNAVAPLDSWIKATGDKRRPIEWMRDENLWERVYDNEDSRHNVEKWISSIKGSLLSSSPRRAS